jgi:hypothetical protein
MCIPWAGFDEAKIIRGKFNPINQQSAAAALVLTGK